MVVLNAIDKSEFELWRRIASAKPFFLHDWRGGCNPPPLCFRRMWARCPRSLRARDADSFITWCKQVCTANSKLKIKWLPCIRVKGMPDFSVQSPSNHLCQKSSHSLVPARPGHSEFCICRGCGRRRRLLPLAKAIRIIQAVRRATI